MNLLSPEKRAGSRLRLLALAPVVCGVLALAPNASALTSPWTTCNATNLTAFTTCINNLGTGPGKTANEIIVLNPIQYHPTSFITIPSGVNVEITGSGTNTALGQTPAWNYHPTTQLGVPTLNGTSEPSGQPDEDFVTIDAGANVVFKGMQFETAAPYGFGVIHDYGNVELDNVNITGNIGGTDLLLTSDPVTGNPAVANVNNSNLSNSSGDALETDSASVATLYNTDVVNNNGGVDGNANLINTLVANNDALSDGYTDCGNGFSFTLTAVDSIDDDGTCAAIAGSGVTTDSYSSLNLGSAKFNGGPTETLALGTGSAAIGKATDCLPADQRFYIRPSTSTCDVGSYQSGGTQDTTLPACPVQGTSAVVISTNSSGVLQEAATISPPLEGIGLDSVTGYTLTNSGGFTPGTVMWNTVSGTPTSGPFDGATYWDETSPSAAEPDFNSVSPFTVTATKNSAADNVSGDTKWSFPLTDWAGQTTTCS